MLPIASLLNPSPTATENRRAKPPHQVECISEPCLVMAPTAKKAKMTKDAAVFSRGKIHGQILYPPFEGTTETIAAEHRALQLHPTGQIAEYHRHIPYTSEKKSFLKKTGRESFEVFQYTFSLAGHERPFTVMWDYNIGLVRMTPFFKACRYPKTMPAKMMGCNPGLRDISHSITGGALAAQGYWVPYAAAKAAASTFCYSIRYALTPLFGIEFADTCIGPDDDGFGSMAIDPQIIRSCTEQAARYHAMSTQSSATTTPAASSPSPLDSNPSTPPSSPLSYRSLRSRLAIKALDTRRDYGTGSERADTAMDSGSGESARTSPMAVNPYRSHLHQPYFAPNYDMAPSVHKWRARSPSPKSSTTEETTIIKKRSMRDVDDDSYDEDFLPSPPAKLANVAPAPKRRKRYIKLSADEVSAVYALVELRVADGWPPRRASL